jgi:hypothetical protein
MAAVLTGFTGAGGADEHPARPAAAVAAIAAITQGTTQRPRFQRPAQWGILPSEDGSSPPMLDARSSTVTSET